MSCPTSQALTEMWRPCTRHPRYEVSWDGRVRNARTGRVLADQPTGQGYRKVNLGRRLQVQVHQLVAEAWHGLAPLGLPHNVDHVDFERTRNVATNLRWLTVAENGGRHKWVTRAEGADHEPEGWTPPTADDEAAALEAMAANGWA